MMSPQLDTDSINTTASSAKSMTSIRTGDYAVEDNSMKRVELFQGTTKFARLFTYADIFLEAALDRTSALAHMLGTNSDCASSFMMSGVSKLTPSWIPAVREGIRENLLKPVLATEAVGPEIASRLLDLGECGLLGVLCSVTLLLVPIIELVSGQDCRIIKKCIRLYVLDLFLQFLGLRKYPTEALSKQATSSSDLVIRAALHQHLDDLTGLWWWICPLVCPIFAAIFDFNVFIALGFSIALFAWSDTRRASAFQRHTISRDQLFLSKLAFSSSEKEDTPEITSQRLNAVLAADLLASREQQLKVEHEKFAALEQLQIERVQHTDAIDWYVRTTGVLSDQVRGANKEADNFRHALIDWHKYLTKQNDASERQIEALKTRNKELKTECGTFIARNHVLEVKEANYIAISNEHNEQNKSLREELHDMNSLIGSLNALVDSTNGKFHQKEEDFTKLEEYVQQKQYSCFEEKVKSIAMLEEHIVKIEAIAKEEIDEKVKSIVLLEEYIVKIEATYVDTQAELNKAKAEIDEKVKSIITLEAHILDNEAVDIDMQAELTEKNKCIVILENQLDHILKKESTDIDMQAEVDKAKAEVDEKVKCIESLEGHIQWKKTNDIIVQAKLSETYAEIKEKNRIIAMLKEETRIADVQAELDKALTEIDEKEECIIMLEEHIQEEIDAGVQAKSHEAKSEIKEMQENITMRKEFILKVEATNINFQAELDNANHVNLGIVDHLRTLKKTIASQVESLVTKDLINASFETDLRAKNAAIGVLKSDMRAAHADNVMLTKHRDQLMETVQSLSKDLGELEVTKTLADQELTECRRRYSWVIARLKQELVSERANRDTKSEVNAKREASDASKIESMRVDMQALENENDELTGIKEWDQVGEDEGEDGDVDSDDEMEDEIDHNLDAIHRGAKSLSLLGHAMRDELNEQNKHKLEVESTASRSHHKSQPDAEAEMQQSSMTQRSGGGSPSENDSVMEAENLNPTIGGAQTKNHDQDDEQNKYTSNESTGENDSEPEIIDSEHSDDEDHLTPSRADIEYADELNSQWKPVKGGLDIRQYEEISIADTGDSDGELVDLTDVDDDE